MSECVFEGSSYIYARTDAIAPWHEDEKRRGEEKKKAFAARSCMHVLSVYKSS